MLYSFFCLHELPILTYAYYRGRRKKFSYAKTKFIHFLDNFSNFTNSAEAIWTFFVTETKDEYISDVSSDMLKA